VSRLLDLSNELLIKGDPEAAFTCTQAAARILAIPHTATQVQHPSFESSFKAVVDDILNSYKGEQS
jgi:hypothetical protein